MIYTGTVLSGIGQASGAFRHNDDNRIKQIEFGIGKKVVAGTLNVYLDKELQLEQHSAVLHEMDEMKKRHPSMEGEWIPRGCKFYKCLVNGETEAWFWRWDEWEHYRNTETNSLIELVSDEHLRGKYKLISGDKIEIEIE